MSIDYAAVMALPTACLGRSMPSSLQAQTTCAMYSLQHWQLFLWNMAMPFGHPLTVHCSESGTVVAQFGSSINFIKSIDEVEGMDIGMDVDASTSIASFRELIFMSEDAGDDGFCNEAFKVLGIFQDENIQ
jgi:hypothetical protein